MANTFSTAGRLGRVLVTGERLKADVVESVTTANISLSTTEVSQLNLTVTDKDFRLLNSGIFYAGGVYTAGSRIDYGGLRFECRAIELQPRGADDLLIITGRSYGPQALKRSRGARVWKNMSPTQFAAQEARNAGLDFTGQTTGKRKTIHRGKTESSWDVLQRLASESGFYCFEAAGRLYFASATFLVAPGRKYISIAWRGSKTADDLDELPNCRRSGDDPKAAATFTAKVRGDNGELALPGMRAQLSGMSVFSNAYMIDTVSINLADNTPVTVSGSTPINPPNEKNTK